MDRFLNRINQAAMAADRIIDMLEYAGFDLTDPNSIISYPNYMNMPGSMTYAYGASRIAIWDEDYCDYVVKIALDEKYEKFCQHEVEVYEAAIKEGLADTFAWCMCYAEPQYNDEGEYEVPGIYVMEYVDCNEDVNSDEIWKYGYSQYCKERGLDSSSYDYADDYDEWNCEEDDGLVLDYVESQMNDEQRRLFNVFMMKWWISDIHNQNIGHIGNRVVILDYAGWNW